MVHPLPKQFNGRLCTIHIQSRHVQVIHKYDIFLAQWWTKHSFAPLVQFGVDNVLGLVGTCACREGHKVGEKVSWHTPQKLVGYGQCLPCSRGANT